MVAGYERCELGDTKGDWMETPIITYDNDEHHELLAVECKFTIDHEGGRVTFEGYATQAVLDALEHVMRKAGE